MRIAEENGLELGLKVTTGCFPRLPLPRVQALRKAFFAQHALKYEKRWRGLRVEIICCYSRTPAPAQFSGSRARRVAQSAAQRPGRLKSVANRHKDLVDVDDLPRA